MRADFLGEKGSQESLYPCLGEPGVWTLPGGEGVETAMDAMFAGCDKKPKAEQRSPSMSTTLSLFPPFRAGKTRRLF
jgi:hypothetical protein